MDRAVRCAQRSWLGTHAAVHYFSYYIHRATKRLLSVSPRLSLSLSVSRFCSVSSPPPSSDQYGFRSMTCYSLLHCVWCGRSASMAPRYRRRRGSTRAAGCLAGGTRRWSAPPPGTTSTSRESDRNREREAGEVDRQAGRHAGTGTHIARTVGRRGRKRSPAPLPRVAVCCNLARFRAWWWCPVGRST